ncbi:MAG TPA: HAD family hydrolase [Nitrososphaera sp.]|jgi:phosphoglycolate phosphatase-like HAD superfamily hydrolase
MYDCALFDIDGVLVDVRKSYNAAIKRTVEYVLRSIAGKSSLSSLPSYRNLVTDQLILKFRQSGGFNNDTDTTYAITLAMLARAPKNMIEGRKFLSQVAENADETGYMSVEKFLSDCYDIEKWKKQLNYPAPVNESMLARVFDELFYGPELFKKRSNLEPKYWQRGGKPLIKNDRISVSSRTMKKLHEMFGGNLAMVSGRSRLAAEYSLKPVMKYFNLDACVFLEDEKREYAKPNPYAIRRAMEVMNAKTAVYAGDSTEDLLMARRAEKQGGVKIAFVGIYGNSPNPSKTIAQFRREGVKAIARSVNQLPNTINKVLAV